MKTKSLAIVVISFALIFCYALSADAAPKELRGDPMKGRIGIGLAAGLINSPAGTGFHIQPSLTYWWNGYFSNTVAVGYGFYSVEYLDYLGERQNARVSFMPSELLATFYAAPGKQINPYFGPGIGLEYLWYTLEDFEGAGEDREVSMTIYSGIARLGVLYRLSPNVGLIAGGRYTHPLNKSDDFEEEGGGTLSLELGLSVFF
jgi:hypothetical protein